MYSLDIYNRVRRACLKDGMSAREAARYFNKDLKPIAKKAGLVIRSCAFKTR